MPKPVLQNIVQFEYQADSFTRQIFCNPSEGKTKPCHDKIPIKMELQNIVEM